MAADQQELLRLVERLTIKPKWAELAREASGETENQKDVVYTELKPTVDRWNVAFQALGSDPVTISLLISSGRELEGGIRELERYDPARIDRHQVPLSRAQAADAVRGRITAAQPPLLLTEHHTALSQAKLFTGAIGLLADTEDKTGKLLNEALELQKRAQAALDVAQQAAAQTGINKQGKAFTTAAEQYRTRAITWRAWAISLGLIMLCAALGSMLWSDGPPLPRSSWSAAANLSHFATRALVFSVLSFAMVVCVRNYAAARHNETVNSHRAGALATFAEFREAAEGGLHAAVLLHATEAVFSSQPTAYAQTASNPSNTHVAEMLKAIQAIQAKDG